VRRVTLFILIFGVALTIPLAYLVVRAHRGLEREEAAELRFFAETLFAQMEEELARLVQREETRGIGDYARPVMPSTLDDMYQASRSGGLSPLPVPFILGYLQNNPNGTCAVSLPPWEQGSDRAQWEENSRRLAEANAGFNRKRSIIAEVTDILDLPQSPASGASATSGTRRESAAESSVADKYLDRERIRKSKTALGQEKSRVERLTPAQALNLARKEALPTPPPAAAGAKSARRPGSPPPAKALDEPPDTGTGVMPVPALSDTPRPASRVAQEEAKGGAEPGDSSPPDPPVGSGTGATPPGVAGGLPTATKDQPAGETGASLPGQPAPTLSAASGESSSPGDILAKGEGSSAREADPPPTLQVEVDPLQSMFVAPDLVYVFRRIVLDSEVYRQGFVVNVPAFLDYLARTHFSDQPMARFASLKLAAREGNFEHASILVGTPAQSASPVFRLKRHFPRPFAFLQATLSCEHIPASEGRKTLSLMTVALAAVFLLGLFAIHKSVALVVELSERRAGFVSSVTHELKTPLTSIRMYIEMLESGMASDPQREADYYRIIKSETGRLARLINNVLEFSRLERRQRKLDCKPGDLGDVVDEVHGIMSEKLRLEGFSLRIDLQPVRCRYDREAMVQVLLNLLENSIKFGKTSPRRELCLGVRPEGNRVLVTVADSGPGIPRHALRRVFDDFYRVDDSLTRKTQGAGIGLSLVRTFVTAMGGKVQAQNNPEAGCTFTIDLPAAPDAQA